MGFGLQEARQIEAAFNEAIRNVIQHAYSGSKNSIITVEFRNFQKYIEVYIKDSGRQFPRSDIIARPLDDRRTRGLGLHLIESFMDYTNYDTSHSSGTELTMVKKKP